MALLVLFLAFIPTITCISLSDFQRIDGFSETCTEAYESQILGCAANDFKDNNPCSIRCVAGLQRISQSVNEACRGVTADPRTLIGLFFQGQGVDALCPTVQTAEPTTSTRRSTVTGEQPTLTQDPPSTTEQTSTEAAATSTDAAETTTTAASTSATTAATSRTIELSTATDDSASSITGQSSSTDGAPPSNAAAPAATSTNPQAFGGDVDPFQGKSSATKMTRNKFGLAIGVGSFVWWLI